MMSEARKRFTAPAFAAAVFIFGAPVFALAAANVPEDVRQEIVLQAAGCYGVNNVLGNGDDFTTSDDDEMRRAALSWAQWYARVFRDYSGLDEEAAGDALRSASNDISFRDLSTDYRLDISIHCESTLPPLLEKWEGYARE